MHPYDADGRLHMAREHAQQVARDYRRSQKAVARKREDEGVSRYERMRRRRVQRASA
jgi:hypothetical protein